MNATLLPSAMHRSGFIVRVRNVHKTSALAKYPTYRVMVDCSAALTARSAGTMTPLFLNKTRLSASRGVILALRCPRSRYLQIVIAIGWPVSTRPERLAASRRGSGQDHIRHQFLAARLRTNRQRQQQADQPADCADCHWDPKSQVPVEREIGHDRTTQAAPDRTLVKAEPRCRRAHLGRETLGEVAWGLAPDSTPGKPSLQPEEHDNHPVVMGEQIERDKRQRDHCRQNHR